MNVEAPRAVAIGERRKPRRKAGGYLRVDTVHQETGRSQGVYHINAVDGDAMASGGLGVLDQPIASGAGFTGDSGPVPFRVEFSFRQRLRFINDKVSVLLKRLQSSRPNRGPARATTTDWWNRKTAR
jgi:hypothetical protein